MIFIKHGIICLMYGYLDESGTPGVACRDNDFLVVSLVVFPDKAAAEKCSASIDRLRRRLKLPEDYEFHYSRNSTGPQAGFVKFLPNLDFQFISIAIKKTESYKFASYDRIAKLLLREIVTYAPNIRIEMDTNPLLFTRLKRNAKELGVKTVRIKQTKSNSNNLVQLADYVAALSSRRAKNSVKDLGQYRAVMKKLIYYSEITG